MRQPRAHGAAVLLMTVAATYPVQAEDIVLRVARADCKRLVTHQSVPDVAYQAGVDVRGRAAVAPAESDIDDRVQLSDDLLIPLEVRLFDSLGGSQALAEARVVIGAVELRAGRAYFNGQPLDEPTAAELAAKCREEMNRGG